MATEPTKRIQLDVPESWVPRIDAVQKLTDRPSRHSTIIRLISLGLEQFGR